MISEAFLLAERAQEHAADQVRTAIAAGDDTAAARLAQLAYRRSGIRRRYRVEYHTVERRRIWQRGDEPAFIERRAPAREDTFSVELAVDAVIACRHRHVGELVVERVEDLGWD